MTYINDAAHLIQGLSPADLARLLVAVGGGAFALTFWSIKITALIVDLRWNNKAKNIKKSIERSNRVSQFDVEEIQEAIRFYTIPDVSQEDPSNSSDLRRVADVRENVFRAVDRFVSPKSEKRHLLILADSGMGKTTFCLNYFAYLDRNPPNGKRTVLISLARKNIKNRIAQIEDKRNTILILDAFDEDSRALKGGNQRLAQLMGFASDFYAVIVTCRSQFFADDEAIPRETGIKVITPRRGGDAPTYKLYKLYLMPFTDDQIQDYITKSFVTALTSFGKRSEAMRYVDDIPELAVRPMLLALLPQLVRDKSNVRELYSLYQFMVHSWLVRESNWIPPDSLMTISKALAVSIYADIARGGPDRVTNERLVNIAASVSIEESHWEHLSGRSLLNRDSEGKFKFAHRSIMEFLVVQAVIDGDDSSLNVLWTDFMRQIFVSWGYASSSDTDLSRAHLILKTDLSKTGLIPLSARPSLPDYVTLADFEKACQRQAPVGGKRKSISPSWRAQTLRYRRKGDNVLLHDIEYDLEWNIPDWPSIKQAGHLHLFRHNIVELNKVETKNSGLRLPSYEEFVTLVEAENALGRQFLARDEFYWLGDVAGDRQHLIVTLSEANEFRERMLRLDGPRMVSGTTSKISVFELSIFFNPKQFNSHRAVDLRLSDRIDPY